jgi:hypothetical protein
MRATLNRLGPGDEKSGQGRIDRTSIFKPMVIQTKDRKRPIVAVAFRCETVVPPPALRGKEQYVVNWWPGAHSKAGGCWGMVKQTGSKPRSALDFLHWNLLCSIFAPVICTVHVMRRMPCGLKGAESLNK